MKRSKPTTNSRPKFKFGVCCICGNRYEGSGRSAWPVKPYGHTCLDCYNTVILPAARQLADEGRAELEERKARRRNIIINH